MNKFYIQIVFFLLSIFIYTNNKTLATGLTPKEQNNKTRVNVLTPKEHNNKTLATNLITKEQIDKILASGLTPREQCNKIIDTILNPEEQNKGPRIHVLTPEEHARINAEIDKKQTNEITKTKAKPKKACYTPEERNIIVIASANINDGYPSNKEYKNTIVESANSFKTDIDSEDDIRNGQLEKKILNIAGYLIEKFRKCVEVTYIEVIDGNRYIDI
ncbi:fam-a protein, fragment [Plasmodium vinckei brucechwatti]|uniref:Fam-a protein n=1 Tax=Plasmodium vinckei brucechwatti TaxID=119398 RepID=A0A6V7RSW8_PLAVN|nr:fam-a protein, fragment [Plasmodium vinckei brucechwatti]